MFSCFFYLVMGQLGKSSLIHILIFIQNNLSARFVVMEPHASSLWFYYLQLKMISSGIVKYYLLSINNEQDLIEVLVLYEFLKDF